MTDEKKRARRLEAVKDYLLAAFPDDTLQVKPQDGGLRWDIEVVRRSRAVHEARVTRRFLDDEDNNPDPVTALTVWGLAAKMKMNGTSPVTVDTPGLS